MRRWKSSSKSWYNFFVHRSSLGRFSTCFEFVSNAMKAGLIPPCWKNLPTLISFCFLDKKYSIKLNMLMQLYSIKSSTASNFYSSANLTFRESTFGEATFRETTFRETTFRETTFRETKFKEACVGFWAIMISFDLSVLWGYVRVLSLLTSTSRCQTDG